MKMNEKRMKNWVGELFSDWNGRKGDQIMGPAEEFKEEIKKDTSMSGKEEL